MEDLIETAGGVLAFLAMLASLAAPSGFAMYLFFEAWLGIIDLAWWQWWIAGIFGAFFGF